MKIDIIKGAETPVTKFFCSSPETDAFFRERGSWSDDILAFCRKMERERDEARAERDILRLDAQREAEHHDRLVGELEKVYRERDEARGKYDSLAAEHMLAVNKLCNERDEAIEKHRLAVIHWQIGVFKMQRERDEAREAFVIATDQMVLAQCKLREANTLAEKANELIARWDQPSWKDTAPTAGFINALRNAVQAYEQKP